jgi:hypothetical protein
MEQLQYRMNKTSTTTAFQRPGLSFDITFQPRYKGGSDPTGISYLVNKSDTSREPGTGKTLGYDGFLTPLTTIECELGITNYTITVEYNHTSNGKVTREDDGSFELVQPSSGLYHYYIPKLPFTNLNASFTEEKAIFHYSQLMMPAIVLEKFKFNLKGVPFLNSTGVRTTVGYNDKEIGNPSGDDGMSFHRRYLEIQSRAVFEALLRLLSGEIKNFGT